MEGTAEERLRARLTSLYGELPDDERALLLAVLARAEGAEVTGFAFDLPAISLLGPDVKSGFDGAVARKAGGDPSSAGKPFLKFEFGTVFTTK